MFLLNISVNLYFISRYETRIKIVTSENISETYLLNPKPFTPFHVRLDLRVLLCTSISSLLSYTNQGNCFPPVDSSSIHVLFGLSLLLLPRCRSLYTALENLWFSKNYAKFVKIIFLLL